jgi:hypothetical protein
MCKIRALPSQPSLCNKYYSTSFSLALDYQENTSEFKSSILKWRISMLDLFKLILVNMSISYKHNWLVFGNFNFRAKLDQP